MSFEIGQIFEEDYPPECAQWCNENNAYIDEIEPIKKKVDEKELINPPVYDGETLVKDAEYGVKQVEKVVRRFQIVAIPGPTPEELEAQELAKAKEQRAEAVEKITVEVDGMVFDGDEVSQERMSRSIVALDDGETIIWVLHDNSIANVTKEQLKMALRLAGQKQTELWTKPYENVSA